MSFNKIRGKRKVNNILKNNFNSEDFVNPYKRLNR